MSISVICRFLCVIGLFAFVCQSSMKAQSVIPEEADSTIMANYGTSVPKPDTIYIYYNQPDSNLEWCTLRALPSDTSKTWDIFWYEADYATKTFVKTDSALNVTSDTLRRKPDGGVYAIFQRDTISESTRISWYAAYNKYPEPRFRDKKADTLSSGVTCSYTEIRAEGIPDTILFFNPVTGRLAQPKEFIWYSYTLEGDPPPAELADNIGQGTTRVYNLSRSAPAPDTTTFVFTSVDKWNRIHTDTVIYYPIVTKAALTDTFLFAKDLSVREEYYNSTAVGAAGGSGEELKSAPIILKLFPDKEKIKNALMYTWEIFPEGLERDTLRDTTYTLTDTIYYILRIPGAKYTASLTTYGPYGICNSTAMADAIEMEPTLLENDKLPFPSFFSPDGNDSNERFRCYDVSVGEGGFRIRIFNRWGRMVHKYEGNIRNWEGWDGKIKDSNDEAPVGVYYYLVDYQAYDKSKGWQNREQKGFVHLFRMME